MLSTMPASGTANHSTVRRPTLLLSPYSSSSSSTSPSRIPTTPTGSPSFTRKLQQQTGASSSSSTTLNNDVIASQVSEVRLAVLGSLGVGKSALVVKYITRRFIQEYDPNLEDIYGRVEIVDGRSVSIQIMDTCDSPDKRPERYLKWANGFAVIFSVVSRQSYDDATRYLDELCKYHRLAGCEALTPVVLVGNKADLERYRTVSRSAGERLASQYDCAYFETSASEDFSSVSAVFGRLLLDVVHYIDLQPALHSLYITETSSKISTLLTSFDSDRKDDSKPLHTSSSGTSSSRRSTAAFKLFNKGFKIFN